MGIAGKTRGGRFRPQEEDLIAIEYSVEEADLGLNANATDAERVSFVAHTWGVRAASSREAVASLQRIVDGDRA